MVTTVSTTQALAMHARQLASEAKALADHVTRTVDPTAAMPAREAASSLAYIAELLEDPELEVGA